MASNLLAAPLGILFDIFSDVFQLSSPTFTILSERFGPAALRNVFEARFYGREQCTHLDLLKPKFHKGGGFLRIVFLGINGVGCQVNENSISGSIF